MARNIIWLVVVAATALIQTTWPDFLKLQEVLPDLPLLLVVYFAIAEGEERAMFTGLIGGIYQDVASNVLLGHHVLCLVVVGYSIGRLSTRIITEHPAVKAGLVLLGGLVNGVLFTVIQYVQSPGSHVIQPVLTSVVPAAFYTALITPLALLILSRIFHREEPALGGYT